MLTCPCRVEELFDKKGQYTDHIIYINKECKKHFPISVFRGRIPEYQNEYITLLNLKQFEYNEHFKLIHNQINFGATSNKIGQFKVGDIYVTPERNVLYITGTSSVANTVNITTKDDFIKEPDSTLHFIDDYVGYYIPSLFVQSWIKILTTEEIEKLRKNDEEKDLSFLVKTFLFREEILNG